MLKKNLLEKLGRYLISHGAYTYYLGWRLSLDTSSEADRDYSITHSKYRQFIPHQIRENAMIEFLNEMAEILEENIHFCKNKRNSSKFSVYMRSEHLTIKTAEHAFEILDALKLRHEILCQKYGQREDQRSLDFDEFDLLADHLVVIDQSKSNKVVATCRVGSSLFSDRFHAQTIFNLDPLLVLKGIKLEVGRICVHPAYRNGTAVSMLLKGIATYVQKIGAAYVFGCTSISPTQSESCVSPTSRHFAFDLKDIRPLPRFLFPLPQIHSTDATQTTRGNADFEVPSPLSFLINAGAQFVALPALDPDFQCINFLTVFKTNILSAKFKRRYFAADPVHPAELSNAVRSQGKTFQSECLMFNSP